MVFDSPEKVQEGKVTVPKMPPRCPYSEDEVYEMTALVSRLTIAGVFDLPKTDRLNDRFPDIPMKRLRDLMCDAWKE